MFGATETPAVGGVDTTKAHAHAAASQPSSGILSKVVAAITGHKTPPSKAAAVIDTTHHSSLNVDRLDSMDAKKVLMQPFVRYSAQSTMMNGYFMIAGGYRVGVSHRFYLKLCQLTDITPCLM
jgi:hypothetical protein